MMTDDQKTVFIRCAGKLIKNGVHMSTLTNKDAKTMMSKIAANAVLIELCDLNHLIVSNICDGDFTTVQPHIEEITERLATCLAIMKAKGEGLNEVLTDEQIDCAVQYTIFEQTRESEIENGKTD